MAKIASWSVWNPAEKFLLLLHLNLKLVRLNHRAGSKKVGSVKEGSNGKIIFARCACSMQGWNTGRSLSDFVLRYGRKLISGRNGRSICNWASGKHGKVDLDNIQSLSSLLQAT